MWNLIILVPIIPLVLLWRATHKEFDKKYEENDLDVVEPGVLAACKTAANLEFGEVCAVLLLFGLTGVFRYFMEFCFHLDRITAIVATWWSLFVAIIIIRIICVIFKETKVLSLTLGELDGTDELLTFLIEVMLMSFGLLLAVI